MSKPTKQAFSIKGGISNVSTYLGRRPPPEVRQMLEILPTITKPIFRGVVKFVVDYIKGTDVKEESWQKLTEGLEDSKESARLLFAGLLTILRTAIRDKIPEDAFKQDLGQLQMQGEFVADLAAVLKKSQADESIQEKHVSFPQLVSLDWRVDVTISTSEMQRVLKPSILMRMQDDSGKIRTFELNTEQFHKLRYSVARVLKEFDTIEKLPILKIDKQ